MKSKLIKELLAVINGIKESDEKTELDLNDSNKESVYSELLIPLMNLTNSDTVKDLHTKLELIINGDADTDEHAELTESLVNYILDDDESDANFSDELNSLVVNCVAVLNQFNIMVDEIEDDDKKEDALTALNDEIIELMNSTKEDLENTDETNDTSTDDDTKDKDETKADVDDLNKDSNNEAGEENPLNEDQNTDTNNQNTDTENQDTETEDTNKEADAQEPSFEIVDSATETNETP